ncbi:MAG: Uncharacterised protein [Flavobacteriaceae bacterium]|nr:MAG: Uncharacterised protein [Flavobacteriaceae bacterium]
MPTPGSPINNGLFFFLLLNICDTLWISSFLPTIGSNSPFSANEVKSFPKLSKTGVLVFFADFTFAFSGSIIGSSLSLSFSKDSSSLKSAVEELSKYSSSRSPSIISL